MIYFFKYIFKLIFLIFKAVCFYKKFISIFKNTYILSIFIFKYIF